MRSPKLLRRYLAKRYLAAILATFLLCSLLIFMIDFLEILRQSGKYGSAPFHKLLYLTLLRLPAYTELLLAFAVQVGAIATLLMLNRKSEISVMRAAGMSAWQFLLPGLIIAFALGILAITVYNPWAAASRAHADAMFAEIFGRESNFLRSQGSGRWLRQDGPDGPTVLGARAVTNKGLSLKQVTALQYDKAGRFKERIDAQRADLLDGYWVLKNAWVTRYGEQPQRFNTYLMSTYLSAERVQDALGSVISVSFWDLPGLIQATEKAGLSTNNFQIQYQLLLSRPWLLIAMVLLGATVSLRSFRSGGIQTMIILGMIGGFGFLLFAEVSRQMGVAGLVSPVVAVWVPITISIFATLTVLLHQEDG